MAFAGGAYISGVETQAVDAGTNLDDHPVTNTGLRPYEGENVAAVTVDRHEYLWYFDTNPGGAALYVVDPALLAGFPSVLMGTELTGANTAGSCSAPGDRHGSSDQNRVGDPVNTYDGNFYEDQTDLNIPGTRGDLVDVQDVQRDLSRRQNGPLGYGWTSNWLQGLTVDSSSGDVTVSCAGGAQITFVPDGAGGYAPDVLADRRLPGEAHGRVMDDGDARQTGHLRLQLVVTS